MQNENTLKAQLFQQLGLIGEPDERAMMLAGEQWNHVTGTAYNFGILEKAIVKMAGAQGTARVKMDKKALVVCCGDHGIAEETAGTDAGKAVTDAVLHIVKGQDMTAAAAAGAKADVFVIDMGIREEMTSGEELAPGTLINRRIGRGTANMTLAPAMSRTDCIQAILTGIKTAAQLVARDYQIIGLGAIGNGGEAAASALISVLLNLPVDEVADKGQTEKIAAIEKAIDRYWKAAGELELKEGRYFRAEAAIELMSHLGGYEIAAMTGLCLGGAIYHMPVVLDGFTSLAAALCASLISQASGAWLLAAHLPEEKGAIKVLRNLHLEPVFQGSMRPGGGIGAALAMGIYETGLTLYQKADLQS